MSERYTYLFILKPEYKQYIKEGLVSGELINAFKENNYDLSQDAKISKTCNEKWMVNDGSGKYKIKEFIWPCEIYVSKVHDLRQNLFLNNKPENALVIVFAFAVVFAVFFAVYLIISTPAKDNSFSEVYFTNHTQLPKEMFTGMQYNLSFTVSASNEKNYALCSYDIYLEEYPGNSELFFHPVKDIKNQLLKSESFAINPKENKTFLYSFIPGEEHVNKKKFLSELNASYWEYIKSGEIDAHLLEAFNERNITLPENTIISAAGEKRWSIKDNAGEYIVSEDNEKLAVLYHQPKRMVFYVTCSSKTYDIFLWCEIKNNQSG